MKTILYLGCVTVLAGTVFGAAKSANDGAEIRMEEGFFLDGTEGILEKNTTGDGWVFRPVEKIALTKKKEYPAGQALPMLPSGVLEQMTRLAGGETTLHVRLWAMATLYKHVNYLYAVFFLPLKAAEAPAEAAPAKTETSAPPATEDSIIPIEILKQIKASASPDLKKFQQVADVTGDINLIGRAGYLQGSGRQKVFAPDAFGQNMDLRQFVLLPGAALEEAEKEMNKAPGRQRYTVSGLVSTYRGQTYILLRRAERTYTHGNFTQ
jgi:hypothetical protein